jgi:ribonuclease D
MIDTPEALETLIERAMSSKYVALDTEFVWERTYYPKLGVIQVGFSEEECFLIDVPALEDLSPLGKIIENPDIEIILHDAPQDLTILRRATGAFPRNVFDTRCAAGFGSLSSVLSLNDLVLQTIDIELLHNETRTDWLHRPLSDKQEAYALDDVRYLPTTREALIARAQKRNREAWLQEELAEYDAPELYEERDPRLQFRRLKGAGRFSARDQAVLRELTAWREEEARQRDRPRSHIIPDKMLLTLAHRKPQSLPSFKSIKELSERKVSHYGEVILQAIETGLAVRAEECPQPLEHPRDKRPFREQLNLAVAHMRKKSMEREIDPPLVATRSEIEKLVMEGGNAAPERHRLLRGWRREFLGLELLALAVS